MRTNYGIILMTVFFFSFGISIPGSAFAVSLGQYLSSDMGHFINFKCDVSTPDSSPSIDMTSASSTRSYGSTMGKLHKYMGYGTIVAAIAAGASGSSGDGFHKGAGDTAAALAVLTCITGFAEYRNYFDMEEGLSTHNIHIVLATLATAGFVATAIDANSNDDDGHAGLGIGSAVLMAIPIIVLHF